MQNMKNGRYWKTFFWLLDHLSFHQILYIETNQNPVSRFFPQFAIELDIFIIFPVSRRSVERVGGAHFCVIALAGNNASFQEM